MARTKRRPGKRTPEQAKKAKLDAENRRRAEQRKKRAKK